MLARQIKCKGYPVDQARVYYGVEVEGHPKQLTSALESDASANSVPTAVATGTTHHQDACPS